MGQGTGLRLFVRHANGLGACFAPSLPRKLGSGPAFFHEALDCRGFGLNVAPD